MAKDLAIVLNDGGLNAAVATALAGQKYRPVMLYGQRGGEEESPRRTAFQRQVDHFKPYRDHTFEWEMGVASMGQQGSDAQTLAGADPRYARSRGPQLMELLPLMAAATRWAAHYRASAIYLGLRVGQGGEEMAQASEYIQIWSELIQLPCGLQELDVVAPLLELEPWQVVDLACQIEAPMELAWTCLEELAEPCGSCRGCRARAAAFQQAGRPDPLQAVRRGVSI